MKNIYFILIPLIIITSGCGAAKISFDVLAPAPVVIPNDIEKVAIVNRSFPSNKDINVIEGILTGEGLDQDTLASTKVLEGMTAVLKDASLFNIAIANETYQGSGIGNLLPDPLPWEVVNQLCMKYNTQAVIALESYDSDFMISGASAGRNILDLSAQGQVRVNCGIRMYYPAHSSILDDFMYKYEMNWGGGGLSILAAADAILNKNKAIRQASFEAGAMYGQRIIPNWVYVSRPYFKKGKGSYDLAEGARMMQLNEWDLAIGALERATETGHLKSRGRAAHNLAVIYEILGELGTAREWTTIAWGRYKEKKSREYDRILAGRMHEQEVLDYQHRK